MEKNTIWAIVLCGIVLFASIFIQTNFIMPKQQAAAEAEKVVNEQSAAEEKAVTEEETSKITAPENLFPTEETTDEESEEEPEDLTEDVDEEDNEEVDEEETDEA